MNRAALRTRIRALGFETDTDTSQNEAIAQADQYINGLRRWPWLEAKDATLTISAGGSSIAPPADFLFADAVRIEKGSERWDLDPLEAQDVKTRLHLDREQGTPLYWMAREGTIHIYPRADATYTVTLDYLKLPALIAVDTDSPLAPTVYHDIWVWGSVSFLAVRLRDWEFHQFAEAQLRARVKEMAQALGIPQRQGSVEVGRSDFWVQASGGWWFG